MLALHDVGFAVLLPFGENTRYDLVVDDGAELRRVQCKTGRLYKGAIRFLPAVRTYTIETRLCRAARTQAKSMRSRSIAPIQAEFISCQSMIWQSSGKAHFE
jgi:PD-(D/E)XK endonuclease